MKSGCHVREPPVNGEDIVRALFLAFLSGERLWNFYRYPDLQKYLRQVIWTIVPALILLICQWSDRRTRRIGAALVLWIAVIIAIHIALGAAGYSKLLRYIILITPAAVLLVALVIDQLVQRWRERRYLLGSKVFTIAAAVLVAAALTFELKQSFVTAFHDNPRMDLIVPLTGLGDVYVR